MLTDILDGNCKLDGKKGRFAGNVGLDQCTLQ